MSFSNWLNENKKRSTEEKKNFVNAVWQKYAPTVPQMDQNRYTTIDGLEGPFQLRSGKVVYYDPKQGKYYDRDSDMYMDDKEYHAHSNPRNESVAGDQMNQMNQNNPQPVSNQIKGNVNVQKLLQYLPSQDPMRIKLAISTAMRGKRLNNLQLISLGNAFIDLLKADPRETTQIMNLLKKVSMENDGE
jgi:hypothetical protein